MSRTFGNFMRTKWFIVHLIEFSFLVIHSVFYFWNIEWQKYKIDLLFIIKRRFLRIVNGNFTEISFHCCIFPNELHLFFHTVWDKFKYWTNFLQHKCNNRMEMCGSNGKSFISTYMIWSYISSNQMLKSLMSVEMS